MREVETVQPLVLLSPRPADYRQAIQLYALFNAGPVNIHPARRAVQMVYFRLPAIRWATSQSPSTSIAP